MKTIYTICMIFIGISINQAQIIESKLSIAAKFNGQSVQLKIVPMDSYHWLMGVDNGYVISRKDFGSQDDFQPIEADKIFPQLEKDWASENKGQLWFEFHTNAVNTIRGLYNDGDDFSSFRAIQRANSNFKMYTLLTMREQQFGELAGLEVTDDSVELGKVYEYKVEIAKTKISSKVTRIHVANQLKSPPLHTTSLDKAVRLTWIHDENSPILGYFFERSLTGLAFDRMNDAPFIPSTIDEKDTSGRNQIVEGFKLDSIGSNYTPYYYRIIAQDAWGDELPPSPVVNGMGVDLTSPSLTDFEVLLDTQAQSFVIEWDPSIDRDVASYFITNSQKLDGLDSVIIQGLPAEGPYEYELSQPIELKNYYIKLGAIDTSGNISISKSKTIFIQDTTPPSKVSNLKGSVDSSGVVELSWSSSKDTNLEGYWLYKSFKKDEDYVRITDTILASTQYKDTCSLELLNNRIYYYVEALDVSFNRSPPSELLDMVLPDTIPPAKIIIKNIEQVEGGVELKWGLPVSEDLKSINIYRAGANENWQLIATVPSSDTLFTDYLNMDDSYSYQVRGMDSSGNIGNVANSVNVDIEKNENILLELAITEIGDRAVLNWSNVGVKYKIYRAVEDEFLLIDYLANNSYSDSSIDRTNDSKYYVKAYDVKGHFISSSKIISIQ